ncbi:hypothetical protein Ddc_20635 [Ditylenchus destructor]|nr:hypothetical protein Ddc_20635 [Ditylenchus destructor]
MRTGAETLSALKLRQPAQLTEPVKMSDQALGSWSRWASSVVNMSKTRKNRVYSVFVVGPPTNFGAIRLAMAGLREYPRACGPAVRARGLTVGNGLTRVRLRTSKIDSMDNGTMVEAFKYLNYCQLAKNSLVSMRFRNVIQTHRHKLALLYVRYIEIESITNVPHVIKVFDKELSSQEYNDWVIRNQYSKEVPLEDQVACTESTQNIPNGYLLNAYAYYKDLKQSDESQLVDVIGGYFDSEAIVLLKRNYAKFVVKDERHEHSTEQIFEFANNDIGKKLQLTVKNHGDHWNVAGFPVVGAALICNLRAIANTKALAAWDSLRESD